MDADNIKIARIKARITQLDLSKLLGISENKLSKIETGRITPSPEVFRKLAKLLKLDEINSAVKNAVK